MTDAKLVLLGSARLIARKLFEGLSAAGAATPEIRTTFDDLRFAIEQAEEGTIDFESAVQAFEKFKLLTTKAAKEDVQVIEGSDA